MTELSSINLSSAPSGSRQTLPAKKEVAHPEPNSNLKPFAHNEYWQLMFGY